MLSNIVLLQYCTLRDLRHTVQIIRGTFVRQVWALWYWVYWGYWVLASKPSMLYCTHRQTINNHVVCQWARHESLWHRDMAAPCAASMFATGPGMKAYGTETMQLHVLQEMLRRAHALSHSPNATLMTTYIYIYI